MIMQRTETAVKETDLVSSNANLLVGLTHLDWWTAAEIVTSQAVNTHFLFMQKCVYMLIGNGGGGEKVPYLTDSQLSSLYI